MNFFTRLQGVFFAPKLTFKFLSEKPFWFDALILLLILLAIFTYIVTPYSNKDRAEILKNNTEYRERIGEENFKQRIEQIENPSQTVVILSSFLLSPATFAVGFLISSLIILAIGRFFSTEGNFKQVFSAYLHANFVDKILGNAIRIPLILSQKSVMKMTTSLAALFPRLEVTSFGFILLSQIDIFQLWLFGVLGYGLSSIFKIEIKKAMVISYGFWLLKSLFYFALTYLGTRLMQ